MGAAGPSNSESSDDCPKKQNYSPCICEKKDSDYRITCSQVPLEDVVRVFKRTTAVEFKSFELYLSPSDVNKTIPADFLGNHSAHYIALECPNNSSKPLSIDPQAFRSSKNYTKGLATRIVNVSDVIYTTQKSFQIVLLVLF